MSIANSGFVLQLFLNHGDNGSSETVHVSGASSAEILFKCSQLVQARRNILARGCSIVWAHLKTLEAPHWILPVITAPLAALPQWDDVRTDEVGVWVKFWTGVGQGEGMFFRFIDGDTMDGDEWELDPGELPPGIPPLPAVIGTATKQELVTNALCTFRDLTHYSKTLPDAPGPIPQYLTFPWQSARYIRITTDAIGRKWQPVSWEARPRANAPAFSPCGMQVCVARSCLELNCRYYIGAAPQRIRFYYARPGSLVLPIRNIFWPWYQDKLISNGPLPGLITGTNKTNWRSGLSFGMAPGLAYTGTQRDFLGLSSILWDPPTPTPPFLLPACDVPVNPLPAFFGRRYWGRGMFAPFYWP